MKTRTEQALKECRKRMADYTAEQRAELHEKALAIIFPNGKWNCAGAGIKHASVYIAKGKSCGICGRYEP